MDKNKSRSAATELRRQAEERLRTAAVDTDLSSINETQRLLHELQVHQIELEMQNAELLQARDDAEISLEKHITGRKQIEEKQKATIELLRLCNKAECTLELIQSLTLFFRKIYDCEAIGVRLRDGDDFPYYETRGFEENSVFSRKLLCDWDHARNAAGNSSHNPVFDCLCGTVIRGGYDPSHPFFTASGSFWTSCASQLLKGAKKTRHCNGDGYESFALLPIRFRGEIMGLFQFNDKRPGYFNREMIVHMEELVDYVAIALAKLRSDEALKTSELSLREAQKISNLGSYAYNFPDDRWTSTAIMDSIFGIDDHYDRSIAGWGELVHPAQRDEMLAYLDELVAGKQPFDREYRIVRKNDGEERWLHGLGRLEYDELGAPLLLLGTIQDITERKQAEEDLRSYARRLLNMEEELKKKLAAELHDDIGSDLTALGINMTLMRQSNGASKELLDRIGDSVKLINRINRTTRSIMGTLRPTGLDDLDLLAALNHHINIFWQRTGLAVSLEVDELFPRLTGDKEIVLFRIIQESLTNIAKHADATSVNITLRTENRTIRLAIRDDGRGFIPPLKSGIREEHGMGLKTMRERCEMIGGTFQLVSLPGCGTVVLVQIGDTGNAD